MTELTDSFSLYGQCVRKGRDLSRSDRKHSSMRINTERIVCCGCADPPPPFSEAVCVCIRTCVHVKHVSVVIYING